MEKIGELIKQKLQEKGKTSVWLARQIPYSRGNIYKIYNKKSIDTATLMRISMALEYDFFKHFSQQLDCTNEKGSLIQDLSDIKDT
ncbi:MAG: helix-turn-helix domain-containing protein [Prevotella sp.]